MSELATETLYDRDYYEHRRKSARRSADIVMRLVFPLIQPQSVVDVGCATGSWLAVAKAHGAREVLGLDRQGLPRDLLEIAPDEFQACDVSQPIALDRRFDLVLALEVAEHLPPELATTFVDGLTRLGPVVLFSAAIPYQGGTGHLNEQWPAYWAERFLDRHYIAVDCLRPLLWHETRLSSHYAQNTLLFVDRARLADYPALLPGLEHDPPLPQWPLHLVHPRVFLKSVMRLSGRSGLPTRELEAAMAAIGPLRRGK